MVSCCRFIWAKQIILFLMEAQASIAAHIIVSNKIKEAKERVAIKKGYPSWEEMENFIIDNNQPVIVAQLLVSAMEDVCKLIITK